MTRWFRLYDDILDDPKVQMLSPELFKTWVNLLAVASKNAGKLPPIQKLAFSLRLSQQDMQSRIEDLITAELIDIMPDGSLEPHNWSKRQWKSDDSAERVKRHREKKKAETPGNAEQHVTETTCNSSVTVTVTPPDTESDTDTEIVVVDARARTTILPKGYLEKLKAAAGDALDDPMRAFGIEDPSIPLMWLNEGCDFDLDVLPAVRKVAQSRRGKNRVNNWNYFTQAVANAKAERERGLPPPTAIEILPRRTSQHPYYAEKEAKDRAWRVALAQVQ